MNFRRLGIAMSLALIAMANVFVFIIGQSYEIADDIHRPFDWSCMAIPVVMEIVALVTITLLVHRMAAERIASQHERERRAGALVDDMRHVSAD